MPISTIVNDIGKDSKYLIYTPSLTDLAFNVTGAGHFYAYRNYLVDRDNLKNLYVIIYTLNGCGNIKYRGRSVRLPAGYAFILNGEEYHNYYTSQTAGAIWEFKWIRFASEHSSVYDNLITHGEAKRIFIDDPSFEQGIDTAVGILEQQEAAKDVLLSSIADKLLTIMYEASQQHLERGLSQAHLDMTSCRRYVLNNYQGHLSVADLADYCCMSEAAFIRKFKKFYSITPYAFIQKTRLSNAALKLETTTLSISDICFSVGYADLNNFSKQFKASFGQSASDYRKQFRRRSPVKDK